MSPELCHVRPLVVLDLVRGIGVERGVPRVRVRGRGKCALVHVGRGVRARRMLVLVLVHAGQQMGRRGRLRLRGRHLVHEIGGVHGLVLGLRVEQLRVQGVAEEGRVDGLARIEAAVAEEVEVAVGRVVDVEGPRGEVGA